jgi:hypothetical protein
MCCCLLLRMGLHPTAAAAIAYYDKVRARARVRAV